MSTRAFRIRARIAAGAVVFVALLIGVWQPGARAPFWQGIEGRLIDARFLLRGPLAAPQGVAILNFDEAAFAQSQEFPPSRRAIAAAVSAAVDGNARAVALDFLLVDERPDDPVLAAALARTKAIIGVAEATQGTEPRDLGGSGFALVVTGEPAAPLPAMAPADSLLAAAALGHVALRQDGDGTVRRLSPALPVNTLNGETWYPGLSIAALAAGREAPVLRAPPSGLGGQLQIGKRTVTLDSTGAVPLVFYGPGGTIPTWSVADANAADLDGRIVFIGASATGFGDRHATMFDPGFPGVELHATLAANLLEGRSLRRDAVAWVWDIVLACAIALAGFMAAAFSRPWLAALGTLALAGGLGAVMQAAFVAGWWLDATTAGLSLLVGVIAGGALRRIEYRRRADNLARYQPPSLVDTLADEAQPRFAQGDQPAVVLFIDVSGFTTYAEPLDPAQTEAFVRLFHGLVEQTAEPLGGFIAHFAGDGVMVVFRPDENAAGDPMPALTFIERLYKVIETHEDWPGLALRVGGHLGPVRTGVVGGQRHRHVSVSGDVVNTASRLEGFAKTSGTALALSDDLLAASDRARDWANAAGLHLAGPQTLKGRRQKITVWTGSPPSR